MSSELNQSVLDDGDGAADIAIIGMAGRFPGAPTVDALWDRLRMGQGAATFFTDEQLRSKGVQEHLLADPSYVKAGMVLADMDRFDAAFFGYAPGEAARLDPQQRLFLEVAWEALEHSGWSPGDRDTARLTGVLAGTGANSYLLMNLLPHQDLRNARDISALLGLMNGNDKDSLSTCVAYKLDLRGPAVTVQTACSTSLVAVHMACRSLLNHEVDMSLAGGVWLNLLQDGGYLHQDGSILSPDGLCRAFDARAQGTVIGSGAGAVVLKRLADALADGDTIHAVIKGSAINNDGSSKIGYAAPSAEGQSEVILAAQAMAGVPPDSIGYVEAHGTGTVLGDPIEVEALTRAFRVGTDRRGFCALGSVKTLVGHLDAAAGVTGLIKATLALRHRQLPPSLNFEQPNPRIDFEASPFYVNTTLRDWPASEMPRRAAVSSFGMGGTNAHVILEEAPTPGKASAPARNWQILPVSARSPAALEQTLSRLSDHLREHADLPLPDVAWTLQIGRKAFAHRAVLVCSDREDAGLALARRDPGRLFVSHLPDRASGSAVAFLFPGQGAQHVGMAASLYRDEAIFRTEVDRCMAVLTPILGLDLRAVLYPELQQPQEKTVEQAAKHLAQTALTQPALFVIEYALARLWMSWGVIPQSMLGHSIGEYVAACLAGVWKLDDALRLVAVRGRLLQALPEGAMLAVGLSEAEVSSYVDDGCGLAAVNASDACVLSGPGETIDAVERDLVAREVAVRRLKVSHAFHSSMLDPMLEDFLAELGRVEFHPPSLPFVSNLTGQWITAAQAVDPAYWVAHLRSTVRFADGLATLMAEPGRVLLEVGPGETLGMLARRHPAAGTGRVVLSSLPHPGRPGPHEPWPASLGRLWLAGVSMDWKRLHEGRRRVPLPTYPFERQRYWIDPPASDGHRSGASMSPTSAAVKRLELDDWFHAPVWQRTDALAVSQRPEPNDDVWLILGQAEGLGGTLKAQLQAMGLRPLLVDVAATTALDTGGGQLVADDQAGHDLLWQLLMGSEPAVVRVVHTWGVDGGAPWPLEEVLARGFFSLRCLGQAYKTWAEENQVRARVEISVVADRLLDVTGSDPVCAAKATSLGACLSLPLDVPGLVCRAIDVQAKVGNGLRWEAVAAQVLAQVSHPILSSERVVAYRGGYRWVRRFEPIQRPPASRSPLRPAGVYLITGGLGGIGRTLAEHLARTVQAKLVLLGRSVQLPAREQWPALLADKPAGREREIDNLRTVMALEALGAEVMVLRADVTDEASMRDALALAKRRFGAVHGLVHAAGEAGSGFAQDTPQAMARVMAPKVQGALALRELLRSEPLEILVLCSSLASVTGGLGQAAYSAANACLDAAAQAWSQDEGESACHVVAIGWDGWRDVGMAADMAWPDGVGIAPAHGVEVFDRILAGPQVPHVLVSTVPLEMRLENASQDWLLALASEGAASALTSTGTRSSRPGLSTPFEAPFEELDVRLAEIWRALLGIEPVGLNDNFFELGGDSLLGIQMLARVKAAFGIAVQNAEFFKDPTIAGLAMQVETRLIEDIEHAS
ncbi:type I polyketide synthase [Paucibacter sp. XJ19-41]|uniref:type I polyketide synthase n=1 Tax=Paucibacter sp. XJ19-41 TaxID=2927824 RepID=UPI00234B052B|nr:type I polyketide synthase [Paucibacter sp. XJ19-41]MDC6169390.1 SDR family NAD(P)-dependent oxidoreductase [Paucibacter sp. XJ19-41]